MTIKIFNKLPTDLSNKEQYKQFVNKLKTYLLDKCYYDLNEYLKDTL